MGLKYKMKRVLPPRVQMLLHTFNHYRLLQAIAYAAGYNLSPVKDYYSPLIARKRLWATRSRWDRPSALIGVDFNIERLTQDLVSLFERYGRELPGLPAYERITSREWGPGYT